MRSSTGWFLLALLFVLLRPSTSIPAGVSCLRVSVEPSPSSQIVAGTDLLILVNFNRPVAVQSKGVYYTAVSFPGSKTVLQILNAVNAIQIGYSNGTAASPISANFVNATALSLTFSGADIPPASEITVRFTENFATNDTLRAGMPPQAPFAYYSTGIQAQPAFARIFDAFCPIDDSPATQGPAEQPLPLTPTGWDVTLSDDKHVHLAFWGAPGSYVRTFCNITDQGVVYQLKECMTVTANVSAPQASARLVQRPSITANYEQLATQLAIDTAFQIETSSSFVNFTLSLLSIGNASAQIMTGGQSRPFDSSIDSTSVSVLEIQSLTTPYLAKFYFPNGSIALIARDTISPRPDPRWFVTWMPSSITLGALCPGTATRNGWNFRDTYHSLNTLNGGPWSVFEPSQASCDQTVTFTVLGSSSPLVSTLTSTASESCALIANALHGNRLVLPDVKVTKPVDPSSWMLVSNDKFAANGASTINTLDVTYYDFMAAFSCSDPMGTGLANQLGSIIQDSQNKLFTKVRNISLLFASNETLASPISLDVDRSLLLFSFDASAVNATSVADLTLSSYNNFILQPNISLVSTWDMTVTGTTEWTINFTIQNTGELEAGFIMTVQCDLASATYEDTQLLQHSEQHTFSAKFSLLATSPGSEVSCTASIATEAQRLWRPDKTLSLPPFAFLLQPGTGCVANDTSDSTLIVADSSWRDAIEGGNATWTAWTEPGGLLGPNPFGLNSSSQPIPTSTFRFIQSASYSVVVFSNQPKVSVLVSVTCEAGGQATSTPVSLSLSVATGTRHLADLSLSMVAKQESYTATCYLGISIPHQCSDSVGKELVQPFSVFVPKFPCSASNFTEPYLSMDKAAWNSDNTTNSATRDLLDLPTSLPWRAVSDSYWALNNINLQNTEMPSSWALLAPFKVKNYGNGSTTVTGSVSCPGNEMLVVMSPSLSTSSCLAPASGSCPLVAVLLSNSSSSFDCTFAVVTVFPADNSDACWSPLGKFYQESKKIGTSDAARPTASSKSSGDFLGIGSRAGSIAVVVLISIVVAAILAVSVFAIAHHIRAKSAVGLHPAIAMDPI